MARFGQNLGRPCTGLLFILLLSSLEGHSLAARVHSHLGIERGLNATVEPGAVATPDLAGGDVPSEQDLTCVAVLCWLESFQRGPGRLNRAFTETDRALSLANAAGAELGRHSVAAVADVGMVGTFVGGILNAIKVKAEACKGNLFSCVGKASLAVVVISVLAILVFIVGHIIAVAATLTAGASLSLGPLGFFFANIFASLCKDDLSEASAETLVQDSMESLARDNPGADTRMSAKNQNRVVGMLARVQTARRRINGNSSLTVKIAQMGLLGRGIRAMLGLSTLQDVQRFCDSMQVTFNPGASLPALREGRGAGEWVEEDFRLTPTRPGSILEGWVWKRSRVLHQWRRRWLVLTPRYLMSFKTRGGAVPTETVFAGTVQRVYHADAEVLQSWSFGVALAERTYFMVCDDEGQREAWVREVSKALLERKP